MISEIFRKALENTGLYLTLANMSNRDKLAAIISRWPFSAKGKSLDYGFFLREKLKTVDLQGQIFPGDSVENSKKLDSLSRLLNNIYMNKYPVRKARGASGLDAKEVKSALNVEFDEYSKKKSKFNFLK